jgi:hypothetical protein
MEYNPGNVQSQAQLTSALLAMLGESGFTEEFPSGCRERVFSRAVTPEVRVMVYTSIHSGRGRVRGRGRDAIRVCLVRSCPDGRDRGLTRTTRVNRTGQIEAIVERTRDRMRAAWASCRRVASCGSCGAPKFVSRNGNEVCSNLCWTR